VKQPTDPNYQPQKYSSGNEGRRHSGLKHPGYAWWKKVLRARGIK
jgi:hypothetical protein